MRWARDGFGLPQRSKGTVQQPLTPDLSKYHSRVPFFLFLFTPAVVAIVVYVLLSLLPSQGWESKLPGNGEQDISIGPPPEGSLMREPLPAPVEVVSLGPEPPPSLSNTPSPKGAAPVSLTNLEGELGDWWSEYLKTPKTGPWQKIPQDAKKHRVMLFGFAAKAIIQEHEERAQVYLRAYGDDIIGHSKDPRVKHLERDRQEKLKNLLNSIWPGAMP